VEAVWKWCFEGWLPIVGRRDCPPSFPHRDDQLGSAHKGDNTLDVVGEDVKSLPTVTLWGSTLHAILHPRLLSSGLDIF
jgi:hypothetical protein